MDREDLAEAGDPEDLEQPLLGADQLQGAVVPASPLESTHQDPEPGRVEELDLLEVDDEVVLPFVDELDDPLPELRRRLPVDLPADLDDGAVVLLTRLERQVHGFSSCSFHQRTDRH